MRPSRRAVWAACAIAALAACGRPDSAVTVKLVDPRKVATIDTSDRAYLVEVHFAPRTLIARLRGIVSPSRIDTVPGIRVAFAPVILEDSVLVGMWVMQDGYPAGSFTFDIATRKVQRAPLPIWFMDMAQFSRPALSPDARYLAYVSTTPEGRLQGQLRRWPDGMIMAHGPSGQQQQYRQPGRAEWLDTDRYTIAYDAEVDHHPVRFTLHGHVINWPQNRVDTVPWSPLGPPEVARAESLSSNMRWMSTAAFPQLPATIVEALRSRDCLIPQSDFRPIPNNVISGSFAVAGQVDWAVLCSRRLQSTILFFWGGPVQCPSELAAAPDGSAITVDAHDSVKYAREIVTLENPYFDSTSTADSSTHPAGPPHVIENALRPRTSSIVWSCHNGQWSEVADSV
jgi:hypothetical protein